VFVQRRTIEAQFSAREPQRPDQKNSLNMKFIRDRYGTIKVQCSGNQPESTCQFVYRGSLGAICRRQNNRDSIFGPPGRQPAIQKLPKYGIRDPHMLYKISFHTLYRDYVHKSAYQFVYRGSLGVVCRTQNNRYLIFSPPGHEPSIKKVPKYGMRDPHMF
jgi:hypothetical protein